MAKITMICEAEDGLRSEVSLSRGGSLDDFCDAFEAFMIVCGYAPETVRNMVTQWAEEIEFNQGEK